MAPPARHRENAGKLYLPAVQRMGPEQVIDGLYLNLEEVQGLRSSSAPLPSREEGSYFIRTMRFDC
jgi:hypothetical protein